MVFCELTIVSAFSSIYLKAWNAKLWMRLLAGGGLIIVVLILDYYLVDFDTASTAFEAIFCFAAAYIYAAGILKLRRREAFYCTVWSYLLTDSAAQILMPLIELIPLRGMRILCCIAGILLIALPVKRFLVQKLTTENRYHVGWQKMLYCMIIAGGYLLLSNYQFIFWRLGGEPETKSNMITLFRLIVGISGILLLYIQNNVENMQRAEQELRVIQQLLYRQQEQYQISQENIDLINRKCHDLRYQMEALRQLKDEKEIDAQLKELEHSAMIYDSIVKTGNPVLDTVLTEKSLICEANQINMTCMADGEGIDFIGKVDLYTMFGNALDNAIECVMKQKDVSKRIIQVAVFHEKSLLMIRVRNYCEENLEFKNGLPVSTKKDRSYHGYGLKSIQYTAEKYGGGIVCQNPKNYYVLQILLPISGNV